MLNRARMIKTDQEIVRIRIANEIAAAAMEHVRGELRAGMKESEAAAVWLPPGEPEMTAEEEAQLREALAGLRDRLASL